MPKITNPAKNTLSPAINNTGRQPTDNTCFNDVLTPMAAIAITSKLLDKLRIMSINQIGNTPTFFKNANTKNIIKKPGIKALTPADILLFFSLKAKNTIITIGINSATLSSLM